MTHGRQQTNNGNASGKNASFQIGLFLIFFLTGIVSSLILMATGFLNRQELQTINNRFESRVWLKWNAASIARLDVSKLMNYHQQHEVERNSWDQTLSWLVEENHPQTAHKYVLFNRLPEDEPPAEAIAAQPWMVPLKSYPLSRTTVANMVEFLNKAGARLIILDNDFPQYSSDDAVLAKAIHDSAAGINGGNSVPVIFARTINRRSGSKFVTEEPTVPRGLISELEKLEPGVDVLKKYTGTSGVLADEDQVVRRAFVRQNDGNGTSYDSIAYKAFKYLSGASDFQALAGTNSDGTGDIASGVGTADNTMGGGSRSRTTSDSAGSTAAGDLSVRQSVGDSESQGVEDTSKIPDVIDVDFAACPNSNIFPVRPLWYLLDPKIRQRLSGSNGDSKDVSVKGSTVVIGDSVSDIFSTPLTNLGTDQMSGAEVLVNSIDTLARHSWPRRLDEHLNGLSSFLYTMLITALGAFVWVLWKAFRPRLTPSTTTVLHPQPDSTTVRQPSKRFYRLLADLFALAAFLLGSLLIAQLTFSYGGLIVPVVVPSVALILGAIAAVIWEREQEREESFLTKIRAAEDKLNFAQEKFEADLKTQEAESKARELLHDQERRKEFVRRINHDLNAPVSVLNWTLVELQGDELPSADAQEKIHRLMTNSDRLCELIDELVQTYDYDANSEVANGNSEHCELSGLLIDLADLEQPLASMRGSTIELKDGIGAVEVKGSRQEIMRVFDNLVRNALKHNDEGTHVRLSASTKDETCTIKVEDNGKGIKKEHLDHIFESGYRVPDSNSDGQGLGLDIVRSLVERNNGQIAVESVPGSGTTFSVTLRRDTHND